MMNDEANMKKYDPVDRLVNFSVLLLEIINEMSGSKAGNQLSG
jgi:hypothetical protein